MTKRPRGDEEDEGSCQRMIGKCKRKFSVPGGIETSHGVTWIRGHKLGQGGFASVYSATSRSDVSSVVFLDDGDGASSSFMPSEFAVKSAEISESSSLRTELEIYSHLNSSSYVVHCFGDEITKSEDGKLYYNLLLEKCTGGSLVSRIRNSGGVGLPENEVRSYTRDIVGGLCYIHGRGYLHCDIRADNILLVPTTCCNGFRAKIGDLGLAKEAYFEPAAAKVGGVRESWRSDIWALGCLVTEMMTGKLFWFEPSEDEEEESDMKDLLWRIGCGYDLPECLSKISEEGRDFCKRCLDSNIDERWSALMLQRHPFLSLSLSPIGLGVGLHNEEQCQD